MKHDPNTFYASSCQDVAFDDYLLLGGGTDINPKIYGEKPLAYTQYPDNARDMDNQFQIDRYIEMGKPIFGICRGFQMLDAHFGGKLIQHTVGHPRGVSVITLQNFPKKGETGGTIDNNRNCHHQIVDPKHTNGELIGWSHYPLTAYMSDGTVEDRDFVPQILYWGGYNALAVQFHPEWHREDHKMNEYLRGLIKSLLGLENVL